MKDPVIIVVDNDFERRYYYSAGAASSGLGWLVWPDSPSAAKGIKPGVVKVYRLDEEATSSLNAELLRVHREVDPHSGKWLKHVKANFEAIFQRVTGIR